MTSHTDGPSVSQENGALGVLAIVRYFSNIPQSVRPRTLMIYLDNRHYMPGMESAFAQYDWFTLHPEAKTSVVASVGTEHLGQVEYNEVGEVYAQTGRVESSFLWARNNQLLIDMAIDAVKASKWPRCQVNCVERPGVNNLLQGVWYGLGGIARTWNIPGYGTMGTQGGYWATTARISAFDKNLFYKQIATMSQLTGQLMVAKLIAIDPLWGTLRTAVNGLANTAFANTSTAVEDKNAILAKLDSVFNLVKADSYQAAITGLQDARTLVTTKIVTASQTALLTQVDSGIAKLQAKL